MKKLLLAAVVLGLLISCGDKLEPSKYDEKGGWREPEKQKQVVLQESNVISADSLISIIMIDYESAMQMGAYKNEYLNRISHLNEVITIQGIVDEVIDGGSAVKLEANFGCPVKGNTIKCFVANNILTGGTSEEQLFSNLQSGQMVVLTGKFIKCGRMGTPSSRGEEDTPGVVQWLTGGCGWYAILEGCHLGGMK